MRLQRRIKLIYIASVIGFIMCIYQLKPTTQNHSRQNYEQRNAFQWIRYSEHNLTEQAKYNNTINTPFLVDTPMCKIPNLDPYDESIRPYLHEGFPITCNRYPSITYADGSKLYINWTAINDSFFEGKFRHCTYQAIYRPFHAEHHDYFTLLGESEEFNTTQDVKHDFVRVQCYNKAYGKIYTNFHQFIHRKNEIEQRCDRAYADHIDRKDNTENLNILMLGVDSVSRLNFQRYFLKTKSYLLNKLQAIEMNGYNKIADNTYVNIVPMTTGKFLEELPWNETMNDVPFDNYTFIWKKFAENGYRTLYAEDAPKIAIFDYLKAGFEIQPADYFNRHFSIAMERDTYAWYHNHHCVTDRLETDIILQYTKRFISEFRREPHFAFTFITRLTHDYLESSAAADIPYYEFFSNLYESNLINNTAIIFYSDHGMRFGDFRKTYSGKLEERLPFMFLIFPAWFLQKYPKMVGNLRKNSFRLSTPFDIYATLVDILNFDGSIKISDRKMRSISLFSEIPEDRSCEDAAILPHWCTCAQQEKLPLKDKLVLKLASHILFEINKNVIEYKDICEALTIAEIDTAVKLLSSDKILRFIESKNDVINRKVTFGNRTLSFVDYQLTLRTKPGDGLFEATIRYNEAQNSCKIIGDISRINAYGDQSHCIEKHHLKKFCYCKKINNV